MESSLEETYYHRLNPAQGFAFQRVYTDDRSLDESLAVEDHDVVMVPRGYHPVVVPYGYESYYLNVMAGPTREWHFRNDPVARMDAQEITEEDDDGSRTVRRRPHRQDPRRQRRPPARRRASLRRRRRRARRERRSPQQHGAQVGQRPRPRWPTRPWARSSSARRPTRTPTSSRARRGAGKAIFCEKPVDLDGRARAQPAPTPSSAPASRA